MDDPTNGAGDDTEGGSDPTPLIVSDSTASGIYGTPFTYTIEAGQDPIEFGAEGLPQGLVLNSATGNITGTPSSVGSFETIIRAHYDEQIAEATLELVIEKARLTVVGAIAHDKVYDGTTAATISGTTLSGVLNDDEVHLDSEDVGIFSQLHAGQNISVFTKMSISGAHSPYYEITQPHLAAHITPKELTVSNANVKTKTYDGTPDAKIEGATLIGVINDDPVHLENQTSGTFAQFGVGTAIQISTEMWISGASLPLDPDESTEDFRITADPDGAWTFFNGPNAHVFSNGNMLVSFVDSAGYTSLTHVDRATHNISTTRIATLAQADDHNDASIVRRQSDGNLLIAYTRHQMDTFSKFRISRVPEPKTLADWSSEITINHGLHSLRSYNNLHYVGDRLFNVIRAGALDPYQTWYVMYSDDDGNHWSDIFKIHSNLPSVSPSEQHNCYLQVVGDSTRNRLWIAANDGYPNSLTVTTSQYCYYIDASTLNMHNPDGELIGPIGTQFDLQSGTNDTSKVYQYSPDIGRAWNWDIQLNPAGDVYIAYQTELLTNPTSIRTSDDRIAYHSAKWNGTEWSHRFLAHAGHGISETSPSYGAGIAFDPMDPETFYFCSNSIDPSAVPQLPPGLNERWNFYKGTQGEAIELLTPDSDPSYYRPNIYRNAEGDSAIFVMKGRYTHWGGLYDCAVEVWFSGVPPEIVSQAGTYADNYVLIQPELTGEITPKTLTVSDLTVENKTYDGTEDTFVTGGTLIGVLPDDEIAFELPSPGKFSQSTVGQDIEVSMNAEIAGEHAANYRVVLPFLFANITKKEITVREAVAQDKKYDGNSAAKIVDAKLEGLIENDEVSLEDHTVGQFTQSSVGTGIKVISSMKIVGPAATNYTLVQPVLDADITPRELIVVDIVAPAKVYDGTGSTPLQGGSLQGVISGDNVNLESSTIGTFSQYGVGTKIEVLSSMSISGADAENYTLLEPVLFADITPKELPVVNAVALNKTYDGTTDATIIEAELQGVIDGDDVTLENHTSGIFAQSEVGSEIEVATAMALAGNDAGNYALLAPMSFADITPAELIVINAKVANKTYDGNAVATIADALLQGVIGSDDVVLENHTTGTFAHANSGAEIEVLTEMSIAGRHAGNYNLTQPSLESDITVRSIAIRASAGLAKTYGKSDPPFTYQILGGELMGADTFTGSLEREDGESAGSYAFNIGNLTAGPDYLLTFVPTSFLITKAELTILVESEQSKVYGDSDPEFAYRIISGELVQSDQLSGSLSRTPGESVGEYQINEGTLTGEPNYAIEVIPNSFHIAKARLLILVEDKTKDYGAPIPELTAIFEGFVNNDTVESLVPPIVLTTSADNISPVGTYPIRIGSVSSPNYRFTLSNGELEIIDVAENVTGVAFDGYIEDGQVFIDSNHSRGWEEGETVTYTASNGSFHMPGKLSEIDANENGILDWGDGAIVIRGGIDVSTGLPLKIPLVAPLGSTVISPLTNLLSAMKPWEANMTETEAGNRIRAAFGISPDVEITHYDSFEREREGDPNSRSVIYAGSLLQDTLVLMTALLHSNSERSESNLSLVVIQAMADQLVETGTLSLTDSDAVGDLLLKCAQLTQSDLDTSLTNACVEIIIAGNRLKEQVYESAPEGSLATEISRVQGVVQGEIADAIRVLHASQTPLSEVEALYTGIQLAELVENAPVGDLRGADTRIGQFQFSHSTFAFKETNENPKLLVTINRNEGNLGEAVLHLGLTSPNGETEEQPIHFNNRQITQRVDVWPIIAARVRLLGLSEIQIELNSDNNETVIGEQKSAILSFPNVSAPIDLLPSRAAMTREGFELRFHGRIDRTYYLEASTDLLTWHRVATIALDNTTTEVYHETSYTDTQSIKFRKRFYRIIPVSAE